MTDDVKNVILSRDVIFKPEPETEKFVNLSLPKIVEREDVCAQINILPGPGNWPQLRFVMRTLLVGDGNPINMWEGWDLCHPGNRRRVNPAVEEFGRQISERPGPQ